MIQNKLKKAESCHYLKLMVLREQKSIRHRAEKRGHLIASYKIYISQRILPGEYIHSNH